MSISNHSKSLEAMNKLIEVVAKLRDPREGCPWDLKQTQESLTPYILEEAHEAVAAIRSANSLAIKDELGDLLLQIVLQAQIASEDNLFSLQEIAEEITKKMIRRHPHVFAGTKVSDVEQVNQNWEKIKADETQDLLSDQLKKYIKTLPPLLAASKISHKAARNGFEWEDVEGVWQKFEEELSEFKEALKTKDKAHQESELGDLLFTCVNLGRWYGLDPSAGLIGTSSRFVARLAKIEEHIDKPLSSYTLEEIESLWKEAKKQLNQKEDQING
jgi:XTP/dITP diphosphohydrolase